ncbi:TIGR03943 family putative permease subunit [Microbacterium sp. SLBN-146]|uniref:TIGR03943 family putative permease subunit n=1 Tax=Microbacterium sp. SLBN-146 TaxID=2768457 RepID=UPI001152FD5D|nr:TIGR03943 family protein [Microbacterium sp. SLBN-146]TQJ30727.1 putative repeat protein (TIGR03943 family) [Microbacterium sp. SLBN-146]
MRDLWERWLGVGIAGALAVLTLVLALTGQLDLYINPANAWFAVAMSVIALVVVAASFGIRRGAERAHDHDHDHETDHEDAGAVSTRRNGVGLVTAAGGVLASLVTVAALVVHPNVLSVDLAIARTSTSPTLFGGEEVVLLAQSGDTANFGVPDWSTVFATATAPEQFVGDAVDLTGFIAPNPDDPDAFLLTRLVITHCVIDAQPATLPVVEAGWAGDHEVGQWVEVEGTVASDGGRLVVRPTAVTPVDVPEDPYEY